MESTKIFEDVVRFLPKHMFPKNKEINKNLKLEKDLGIYGEDAWYLLEDFSKEFNVNIDDFKLSEYFTSENSWFIKWLHKTFSISKSEHKKDLTINDLVLAIKKGKLE